MVAGCLLIVDAHTGRHTSMAAHPVDHMGNIITVNSLDQIIELVAEYSHEDAILIGGNGQETIIDIQERIKLISEKL